MSGWIRWSYVLPRLAAVAIPVGLVWWGLDPLVRRALITAGQRAVGAKVEIGAVHTRLLNPQIRLEHLCVADPRHPMQNLLEADEVLLALDGDGLLRRKYVVRQGRVSGLRFGTDRATSGALDRRADSYDTKPGGWGEAIGESARNTAAQQLRQWGELLRAGALDQVEQLQTVRVSRELAERWPPEFHRLQTRLQALRQKAQALREMFQGELDPKQLARHPKRLLEDPQALVRATTEVDELYRQLADFRAELNRLAQQLQADRRAIQQAQEHDLETLRRLVPPKGLDPEELSQYLLGPELSRRVSTVLRWVQWARQHWPHFEESAPPDRHRGVDVVFAGTRKRPDWLFQQLAIEGQARVEEEVIRFRGTATDLCSQPAWHGKPTTLSIEVAGKVRVEVEARVDRTGPTPRDHLVVRCPAIEQPPRVWGDPEGLALVVSPGQTRLDLVLDLAERQLQGRLVVVQEPLELVPQAERLQHEPWWPELELALGQIRSMEATVEISGSIDRPQWRLISNLGPQVAEAVNRGLDRLYEKHRKELLALAERRASEELVRFEARWIAQQHDLARQLDLTSAEVQDLRQLVAQRVPHFQNMLPDKLPKNLPLRF